jgi:hypothetical protein
MALIYAIVWFYGGPVYAMSKFSLAGQSTIVYYLIGLGTIATYLPLHAWRHWQDQKSKAAGPTAPVDPGPALPEPIRE